MKELLLNNSRIKKENEGEDDEDKERESKKERVKGCAQKEMNKKNQEV